MSINKNREDINGKDGRASLRDLYTLVGEMRSELSSSIQRLENKFDTLEAGRLSTLESKFANLEGRIVATTGVIAFVVSIIIAVVSFLVKN